MTDEDIMIELWARRVLGTSEYQTFIDACDHWYGSVKLLAVNDDFSAYVKFDIIPFYVRDYIRKGGGANG